MDSQPRLLPCDLVVREVVAIRDANAAVDGDPAHHLAVHVLAPLAAHLPDGGVRLLPASDCYLDDVAELLPQRRADGAAETRVHVGTVEHLAVHVELELIDRGITSAHRSRSAIALEM